MIENISFSGGLGTMTQQSSNLARTASLPLA